MTGLLIRWVGTTVALWLAIRYVPGLRFDGEPLRLFLVALVFGLVNATLKPIVKMLTCPLYVLTLGFFAFVVNALMLWVTALLSNHFGLRFTVATLEAAFIGGLVIGVVNVVTSVVQWVAED
ncbi:MAG: phage holin family protein [Gemmatimonadales bacterium]|nr:phage holin family protein [Gemmatimonadales bacterium]